MATKWGCCVGDGAKCIKNTCWSSVRSAQKVMLPSRQKEEWVWVWGCVCVQAKACKIFKGKLSFTAAQSKFGQFSNSLSNTHTHKLTQSFLLSVNSNQVLVCRSSPMSKKNSTEKRTISPSSIRTICVSAPPHTHTLLPYTSLQPSTSFFPASLFLWDKR